MSQFLEGVITLGGIYAILALGLNLQMGNAGLINFGIVGYFAAGAYGYAILTAPKPSILDAYVLAPGWPTWAGVVGACVLAVIVAAVTSWPALRLRGEYLALMTFGFAEIIQVVATNASKLTNGTLGFSNIAPPFASVGGQNYGWFFAGIVVAILALVFFVLRRITSSPYGWTLRALRDDELAATLSGKKVPRLRLQAFVIGGAVYGLAGVCFAWYNGVVNATQFDIVLTITIFVAFALGRFRSDIGSVVGAFALVALQQGAVQIGSWFSPAVASRSGDGALSLEGLLLVVLLSAQATNRSVVPTWLRRRRRRPEEPGASPPTPHALVSPDVAEGAR